MQFTELKLTNWGPFYGSHTIPLSVTAAAPVVIFRGENMRGKTSILRGIVWALYGEIREQDGRTLLDVGRMVNIDAIEGRSVEFEVKLKFTHNGSEFTLYRTSRASQDLQGNVQVDLPKVDLISTGSSPYPAAQIPEVIDGILAREISDFFLFDGEMLNRFDERLREEGSASQGFVRAQVERALGLPFLKDLGRDLDSISTDVTTSIDQMVRRAKAHNKESDAYHAKREELSAIDKDLADLRRHQEKNTLDLERAEQSLAKVNEVKDAFYRRKGLQEQLDSTNATVRDYQDALAERFENVWWLPLAAKLLDEMDFIEDKLDAAEKASRYRYRSELKIQHIEEQLASGTCPTCGQDVHLTNEGELRMQLEELRSSLTGYDDNELDDLRARKTRLKRFSNARGLLETVRNQEQDIRKERFRNDKRQQEILEISDRLSGTNVEIDVLERRYSELKDTSRKFSSTISGQEIKRSQVKAEASRMGAKLADQPEVAPADRQLQAMANEGIELVRKSYDEFASTMRERVQVATSDLFRRLTTEKDYSGVVISRDYSLAVTDHQSRSLNLISAGANQILTMAFIGALGECSVDEAPMVMDTPFGRLDVGHRRAILNWVGTFNRQVILFVQSGEYDPTRDGETLAGKIGREFTIDRLTPNRSEVTQA